jgi:hypothetical protein
MQTAHGQPPRKGRPKGRWNEEALKMEVGSVATFTYEEYGPKAVLNAHSLQGALIRVYGRGAASRRTFSDRVEVARVA